MAEEVKKAGYGMTLEEQNAIALRLLGRLEGGDRLDMLLKKCNDLVEAGKPLNRREFLASVQVEAKEKVDDGIKAAEAAKAAAEKRIAQLKKIRGE